MKYRFLKYIILLLFPFAMHAQVFEKSLGSNKWKFKKKNDKSWLKATVPGTVHTDLFANEKIPDPFYGNNEKQLQWIENEDWEYKTIFSISHIEFYQSHIELQFDGLDTYAKVFVNDSLVLLADNMFRSWKVDVKKYVRKGKNNLRIVFESAVKRGKEAAAKLSYTLPGDEKVFTRKAQYQYGWDWGPRFVTCGIWKDVKLVFWSTMKINSIKSEQIFLSDSIAKLKFHVEVMSDTVGKFISILYQNKYRAKEPDDNRSGAYITLKKGINTFVIEHEIEKPKIWWSNGLGEHPLYEFSIHISDLDTTNYVAGGPTDFQPRPYFIQIYDFKKLQIGLRTIELIQDKDSIGKSFYFKLNGVPVFMKGANYIPSDNFLPRIHRENYFTTIRNAVDANMNMLRVWGGGVYADDAFYDACDKNGILIWQDFMFACAMYPGDDHFVNNVATEVIDQVERLRNHPCIALWCGNNEVDEGWKNWGWQKQFKYSEKDSTTIAQNNAALFNYLINDLVKLHDGTRPYWPSSPSIGWGHKESLLEGDSHYWGVWWGMEPFENYEKKVGRFVSEYGFQGMTSVDAYKKMGVYKYVGPSVDTLVLNAHQKHPTGFQTIHTYMERDYKIPKKFEDYVYVSQLLQARGMKTAIEAHRRAKPNCMGTLYWQLNDCWPVTSWSTVDYNYNWKASQYQVKRSYRDVIISVIENDSNCLVYVVSDMMNKLQGTLNLELFDFSGKLLWSDSSAISVNTNSSKIVYQFNIDSLKNIDKCSVVMKCTFIDDLSKFSDRIDGNQFSEVSTLHYFEKPKNLKLNKANIVFSQDSGTNKSVFSIKSDVLVKDVCLTIEGESIILSDNYFDLLPNEIKTIYVYTRPNSLNMNHLDKKIKIKSLIDAQ